MLYWLTFDMWIPVRVQIENNFCVLLCFCLYMWYCPFFYFPHLLHSCNDLSVYVDVNIMENSNFYVKCWKLFDSDNISMISTRETFHGWWNLWKTWKFIPQLYHVLTVTCICGICDTGRDRQCWNFYVTECHGKIHNITIHRGILIWLMYSLN